MAEQDQNRNEAATPFRLEDARKKGTVPKSLDFNAFVVLSAAIMALYFGTSRIVEKELAIFKNIFLNAHQLMFNEQGISQFISGLIAECLLVLAPLFLVLMVAAVIANFIQIGPIFSFFPLKPDFNRINPIQGFKRLFSMKLLVEAVKTILKFILIGSVVYFSILSMLPQLVALYQVHPNSAGSTISNLLGSLLFKILIAIAFISLIDLVYSRWDFAKRMRMSRKDILDEHKRREGDPRIKSRMRELQKEAIKRAKSLGRVKDADVLITNPTHYAVAVKYDRNVIDAPILVSKGAGFLAGRMKWIARRNHVPIVENKKLARHLFFRGTLEKPVPVSQYAQVAKILVWAYTIKGIDPSEKTRAYGG